MSFVRGGDGILRNHSNPFLIQHAVTYLKDCRELLKKNGFRPGEDPWRLKELYGLVQGKFAPAGLFEDYMRHSRMANDTLEIKRSGVTADEMKATMLAAVDEEIEFLDFYRECLVRWQRDRINLAAESALVPSNSDRLVRYARYLSEEFDRLLHQLERLRRMRL